jgi:ubiquinone/menaquinone biosynthesis C-methylase UbiE
MQSTARVDDRARKAHHRAMWAGGDYHRFATEALWSFGPELVAVCGIGPGMRVLDVAAGSGNVAIRAAEAGADVVASDLTPENFAAGRREARAHGVDLAWVEADAEALPFGDGEFDVVTSSVGAIFAPRHQVVADEMLRVCRSGGTIGMIAITSSGWTGGLFDVLRGGAVDEVFTSALEWGREDHVRELFGDRVASLEMRREPFVMGRFRSPAAMRDFFKTTHPVVVSIYSELDAARAADLDRELVLVAERKNGGDGPLVCEGEYLLIVARKR